MDIYPKNVNDDASAEFASLVDQADEESDARWLEGIIAEGDEQPAQAEEETARLEFDIPGDDGGEGDGNVERFDVDDRMGGDITPEPEEETDDSFVGKAKSVISDIAKGVVVEGAPQMASGALDALAEVGDLLEEMSPEMGGLQITDPETGEFDVKFLNSDEFNTDKAKDNRIFKALQADDADTVTGGFLKSTAQFLTGFLPAAKGLKAVGLAGKSATAVAGSSLAAGAIADAVVFDPYEDRLSTYLNEVPVLKEIVPDYLADSDPENQSAWEGRLKNAIEGAGIGLAADGLFRAFKYYKQQRADNGGEIAQPQSVREQALRDQLLDMKNDSPAQKIEDTAIAPLGNPDSEDMFIAADDGDATLQSALERLGAAKERATPEQVKNQVTKIVDISERIKNQLPEAQSPMDEALNLIRKGKTGAEDVMKKLHKRPADAAIKKLGGIDPKSVLAAELRARDITPKTNPGLFKQGGIRSLDNLPRSEFPIFGSDGGDDIGNYVAQQEWIDALEVENGGNPLRSQDELTELENANITKDLPEALEELGIDVDQLSNKEVMDRIKQIDDEAELRARTQEDVPDDAAVRDGDDIANELEQIDEGAALKAADAPVPVSPTGKIFVNHARIREPGDVKHLLQSLADADADNINKKRGGAHVSHAQQIKASDKEFIDLKDLIGRDPGPMSASQAIAARRIMNASGEQVRDLAGKAAADTATSADLYNFRRSMIVHYAIQAEVIAARTETARALGSWRVFTGSTKKARNIVCEI